MITVLDLCLKLTIWFLLTADLSLVNILLGLVIALILPGKYAIASRLKDWLRVLGEVLLAIPQAYIEAVEMMIWPHRYEEVTMERVKPNRTSGLVFLDIFLITFTPKTIVLQYHKHGWYEVHRVVRRKRP
jgi:multicomponent Na+:H+ antiporter subunit E